MFNKLKEKFAIIKNLRREIKKLKQQYEERKKEIIFLQYQCANPKAEKVIEGIISRGIDWYDYNTLQLDGRLAYYQGAQSILVNETLKNELNRFIADQIKFIGYESKSHEQTMHIRSGIVAIETLIDRLKYIPEPNRDIEANIDTLSEGI